MKSDNKLQWLLILLMIAILFFNYVVLGDLQSESEPKQNNIEVEGNTIKIKVDPNSNQSAEQILEQGLKEYIRQNNANK